MNRFALNEPTTVTLEHLNLRDERHGEDVVAAIDLKFSMEVANTVLEFFDPALREWLYFKSPAPVATPPQGALDLEEPNDLPDLRFPQLEQLRWHDDLEGYTLTVDYGLGGKSSVHMTDCRVNNFRLECRPGGTVLVTWRVQRSQPDERAVGKLSSLLKRDVQITLTPSPETAALMEEPEEREPFEKPARKARGKVLEATDVFLEQHGEGSTRTR